MILLALGLRPLRRITEDISGIESGELERLEGNYPVELELLQRNLNHLLDTEQANQTRYRNALDSLAHSLKTPLSVIRSSLPEDDSARTVAMENAVTDMQHLIATRLHRAAASARSSNAPAVDVKTQVERLVQSLKRVYSQKLINIDVMIDPELAFYGEQRDFLELTGNLLDNACKYGGGQIRLSACAMDAMRSAPVSACRWTITARVLLRISVNNYCNAVYGVMSGSRAMAWAWPSSGNCQALIMVK